MASETATTASPTTVSKWADTEKIALLISVIKASGGRVKWADVSVPAGRTTQSAAKMYSEMMKASAGVTMTGGADITPSKKRARKNITTTTTTGDDETLAPVEKKKRVRKPKVVPAAAVRDDEDGEEEEGEGEEGEGRDKKKVKVEAGDEDEDVDLYDQD